MHRNEEPIYRIESVEVMKLSFASLLNRARVITPFDRNWTTFILEYTRSNLTRISDCLIALQGLASQIERTAGRRYCAGHWLDAALPLSLLWSAGPLKLPRPSEYRAPTWSWASINGQLTFDIEPLIPEAETIEIKLLRTTALATHQHHLSKVPLAALLLSGRLFPATLISASWLDPVGRLQLGRMQWKPEILSLAIKQVFMT